jgi:arginine repressor
VAIDRYLEENGLSHSEIESALREILAARRIPTQQVVVDYLAVQHPLIVRQDMSIVLDALGYMRVIRMSMGRAYFAW